jgi:hypothetical protein
MSSVTWLRENVDNYANEIRALLDELGWSQRHAARQLEFEERAYRDYCMGRPCPILPVLALRQLVDMRRRGIDVDRSLKELVDEWLK